MSLPPDSPVRRSGGDLADYASLVRRRWPILLFFLAAGLGGGVALLRLTPPAYTATAQVLVSPTGLSEQTNQVTNRQREPLNLDTEVQIAQSAVVAKKARAVLRSTPEPVDVSVPPNTSVLEISYTATDPRTAAAGAGAYAQAYLANREESATQALDAQLKALLAKLKQVNASLVTVADTLPGLARGTAERTIALQRQTVLSRQIYNLTIRYDALRTVPVTPGSVISEAVAPAEPSAPSPPLHLGSGLMIGLLAGVGAAWVRDRLDTRIRTGADLRRLTGLDVLSAEEIGELTDGAGSAVLLITVPGTSSRDVAQAVRGLNERRIPVLGALAAPPAGPPAVSGAQPPESGLPSESGRTPRTGRTSKTGRVPKTRRTRAPAPAAASASAPAPASSDGTAHPVSGGRPAPAQAPLPSQPHPPAADKMVFPT
ncbi:Wzz/FepE/Etk N-terminal domain-containing protein [Streptosporangium canum]|uniref:YveK family protein n=1 Tax=Streptosporangium canum TaxID=324952 RepID=UPI0033A7FA60